MLDFKAILVRINSDSYQTRGQMIFFANNTQIAKAAILELPWKNNERSVSCIAEGNLIVRKVYNHYKFGNCFIINAPQRSEVMIHGGNYTSQIRGCMLPGAYFADINKDNQLDVVNSNNTLAMLFAAAPDEFTLKITSL